MINNPKLFKRGLIFFFSLFLPCYAMAQSLPPWAWAVSADGSGKSAARITVSGGYVYASGVFTGAIELGDSTFQSQGAGDIFLAKYTTGGKFIWAKHAGGPYEDFTAGVAVDEKGDVYTAGYFSDTLKFGNGNQIASSDTLPNRATSSDVFIAKYNAAGELAWAHPAGGIYTDRIFGITYDRNGSIYLSGDVGPGKAQFDTVTIQGPNYSSILLAKYDTSGHIRWAKHIGSSNGGIGITVKTDVNNNVYMSGDIPDGYTYFDTIKAQIPYYQYGGVFTAKFNGTGQTQWVNLAGGNCATYPSGLDIDNKGNVYISGSLFNDITYFGTTPVNSATTHSCSGTFSAFIAKYNSKGQLAFARNAGIGDYYDNYLNSIACDGDAGILATGSFSQKFACSGDTIFTNGDADLLVARYDTLGMPLYGINVGGINKESGSVILKDDAGNIYVSGTIMSPVVNFGNHALTHTGNDFGMLVAKLSATTGIPTQPWTPSVFSFTFSPNPSNGHIIIHQPAHIFETATIWDQLGRICTTSSLSESTLETPMQITGLSEGLYYLNLDGRQGSATQKITIHY